MSGDLVDLIERAAKRVLSHARAATRGPWTAEPASSPSGVVARPAGQDGPRVYVFTGAGAVPAHERLANPRYSALMHPPLGLALGQWLQDAARREREYRGATEPAWDPPEPDEEAYVAGILAAALLREDPADYGLVDRPEVHT